MATRVTLPPIDHATASDSAQVSDTAQTSDSAAAGEPTGAPVPVSKVQLLNDRGDREAEARWLRAAARPGVVRLLSTSTNPFTIVTAHAGARTLRTARLDPAAGLQLLIEVGTLLTELHRDGFTHGKLTVDHIIVGPGGPVLCSPDGTITDTDRDLDGIARCMRELSRQWDEARLSAPWRPQWDRLTERFESHDDPSRSAMRATRALERLATAPLEPSITKRSPRPRLSRSLAMISCVVLLAIGGLSLVPGAKPDTATGPRVQIEGVTYAVGSAGDDVAYLDAPCDPDAPVVTLRPSTGEIWVFAAVGDGAASLPVATVPGATELRAEVRQRPTGSCKIAVARGPAGASEIDTAALMGTDLLTNSRSETVGDG